MDKTIGIDESDKVIDAVVDILLDLFEEDEKKEEQDPERWDGLS